MPEPSEYVITPKGVKDWPTDTDAVIAAVKGCQQGMGGIFPNGTASFYVHSRARATTNVETMVTTIVAERDAEIAGGGDTGTAAPTAPTPNTKAGA